MAREPSATTIFPRTDWADLGRAAAADEASLDRLIRLYRQPLRIFLAATFPSLKDQAEQLLQDFAGDKLIQADWLRRADQNRGRFRDFLKASLRNFVLDYLNRAEMKHSAVSIEDLERELPEPEAPSEAFDLAWARAVLTETLQRMEADCGQPGPEQPRRGQIWEMFCVRLLEPIFNGTEPPAYDQLIERFALKSPTDASNTLLSAKRIFKAHLGRVIKEYAGQDAAAAVEIQALEDFLGRLAKRG
jgi:DNA-directed RNA polymerase specialized sigma24 family protein